MVIEEFDRKEGRHEVRSFRLHHRNRFVVEERAVFDRIHAGTNGSLGARGSVGVSRDLFPQRVCFIDDGIQLGLRQLRRIDFVCEREDPAGGMDLN